MVVEKRQAPSPESTRPVCYVGSRDICTRDGKFHFGISDSNSNILGEWLLWVGTFALVTLHHYVLLIAPLQ